MPKIISPQLVVFIKNLLIHFDLIKFAEMTPIDSSMRPTEFLNLLRDLSGISIRKLQQIKQELADAGKVQEECYKYKKLNNLFILFKEKFKRVSVNQNWLEF